MGAQLKAVDSAHSVVDVIPNLEPDELKVAYTGVESGFCRPAMLLAFLPYGYAPCVFFSGKLAWQ